MKNPFKHLAVVLLAIALVVPPGLSAFPQKAEAAADCPGGWTAVGDTECRIIITSGTSLSVPSNWNNANNTIEVIGGGGTASRTTAGGGGAGDEIDLSGDEDPPEPDPPAGGGGGGVGGEI